MDFSDNKYCVTCKGECCKTMGCHLSPEDINVAITYEALKELLDTGNYSIDWWEEYELSGIGKVNGYFLRVRNVDGPIVDPSWGGKCKLLTEQGCSLSFNERPKGGRMLLSKKGALDRCYQYYTKKQCADDWAKYYDILSRLVVEYDG